jgi:hypothetical protein
MALELTTGALTGIAGVVRYRKSSAWSDTSQKSA